MKRIFLGYDIRPKINRRPLNDVKYISSNLCCGDVETVFSADGDVWPSAFNGVSGLPSFKGSIQDLWLGHELILGAAHQLPCSFDGLLLCGVEVVLIDEPKDEVESWVNRTQPVEPMWPNLFMECIGFDVGDAFLKSSLTDLGLSPEASQIIPQLKESITSGHLIRSDRFDVAKEYRDLANNKIDYYMPFYVFSVYVTSLLDALKSYKLSTEATH